MYIYRLEKDGLGPYQGARGTGLLELLELLGVEGSIANHIDAVEDVDNMIRADKAKLYADVASYGCTSVEQLLYYVGSDFLRICAVLDYHVVSYWIPDNKLWYSKNQVIFHKKYKRKAVPIAPASKYVENLSLFQRAIDIMLLLLYVPVVPRWALFLLK